MMLKADKGNHENYAKNQDLSYPTDKMTQLYSIT